LKFYYVVILYVFSNQQCQNVACVTIFAVAAAVAWTYIAGSDTRMRVYYRLENTVCLSNGGEYM